MPDISVPSAGVRCCTLVAAESSAFFSGSALRARSVTAISSKGAHLTSGKVGFNGSYWVAAKQWRLWGIYLVTGELVVVISMIFVANCRRIEWIDRLSRPVSGLLWKGVGGGLRSGGDGCHFVWKIQNIVRKCSLYTKQAPLGVCESSVSTPYANRRVNGVEARDGVF